MEIFNYQVDDVRLLTGVLIGVTVKTVASSLNFIFSWTFGRMFSFRKTTIFSGVYDCEYIIPWKPPEKDRRYERILLIHVGSSYLGYLINHPNPPTDKEYRTIDKPVLRLKGELYEERYFIGEWVHPYERGRHHGAFNLMIDEDGERHCGEWNGKSSDFNKILSGRWVWTLADDQSYGIVKFLWERFFGCKKNDNI